MKAELARTIAELYDAQQECAELHDALAAARMVIDEAQAKIRGREQAAARDQVAAAVVIASSVRSCDDCKGRPNIWCSWCWQQPRMCGLSRAETLADLQARYLEVRQHTLSTAGLPYEDAIVGQAEYVIDEARELKAAAQDLANDGAVVDAAGCPITTSELLTATRHEIADVTLAAVTLANLLGVTVEACISEKTEADRGRG